MDEPFQRGNQYAMLKDDTIAATKRTVASTYDSRHDGSSRGKEVVMVKTKEVSMNSKGLDAPALEEGRERQENVTART